MAQSDLRGLTESLRDVHKGQDSGLKNIKSVNRGLIYIGLTEGLQRDRLNSAQRRLTKGFQRFHRGVTECLQGSQRV